MKAASILETIGDTPHIRINRLYADRPQVEVWMKAERAGTLRVNHTLPPMRLPSPITVSPPKIVALA